MRRIIKVQVDKPPVMQVVSGSSVRFTSVLTSSLTPDREQWSQKNLLKAFKVLEFYTFYMAPHLHNLLATSFFIIFISFYIYVYAVVYTISILFKNTPTSIRIMTSE